MTDNISAGLKALRPKQSLKFPMTFRLIFGCKQCDKGFPLEEGHAVRTAFSLNELEDFVITFSKTVEPRTIKCSCGLEAEYHPKDVGFYALEG
jgi:hypothetical protein